MATKRRTDHEPTSPPRGPEGPAVRAASNDEHSSRARAEPKPERPADQAAEPAADQAAEPAAHQAEERATHQAEERAAEEKPAPSEQPAPDRRVEELASQLEEANSRHLRLAADFDNFKKRSRQEQVDTMRYAAATVAERLLPVLDDAERAMSHIPDGVDESWLKGVRLTFQKLQEVLSSVGVERIEAVGSRFDPKLHEAVGYEETAEHPEDTVVVELRAGYRMHDRVLRPALVKVARPPA